jgi:hypothetical protein
VDRGINTPQIWNLPSFPALTETPQQRVQRINKELA